MKIVYSKRYINSIKKIKKKYEECRRLGLIIKLIENSSDYNSLKNNPLSLIYGFEELKFELNNYCSFNLNKNGGMVRFIISYDKIDTIIAEYISTNHYKDFKKIL